LLSKLIEATADDDINVFLHRQISVEVTNSIKREYVNSTNT